MALPHIGQSSPPCAILSSSDLKPGNLQLLQTVRSVAMTWRPVATQYGRLFLHCVHFSSDSGTENEQKGHGVDLGGSSPSPSPFFGRFLHLAVGY